MGFTDKYRILDRIGSGAMAQYGAENDRSRAIPRAETLLRAAASRRLLPRLDALFLDGARPNLRALPRSRHCRGAGSVVPA